MDSYLNIIEQIGEGAFSKLYSAFDLHLNKYVALKIEKYNTLLSIIEERKLKGGNKMVEEESE